MVDSMDLILQWAGCALALIGMGMVASRASWSPWGWPITLASNLCWIAYAGFVDAPGLLAQSVAFLAVNGWGTWRWVIRP